MACTGPVVHGNGSSLPLPPSSCSWCFLCCRFDPLWGVLGRNMVRIWSDKVVYSGILVWGIECLLDCRWWHSRFSCRLRVLKLFQEQDDVSVVSFKVRVAVSRIPGCHCLSSTLKPVTHFERLHSEVLAAAWRIVIFLGVEARHLQIAVMWSEFDSGLCQELPVVIN